MRILTVLRVDPSVATKRSLAMSWLAASVLLLSGCNVVIRNPADQSTIAAPTVAVNVGLPWLYRPGTFSARLDERDVTSQFTVDAQNGTANASLTVTPGQHVLDIGACWGLNIYFVQQPPWPVQGCSGVRATFTAVQPHLVLGPPGLRVPVSQSGTATVQAVPAPSGALPVTLSSSPLSRLGTPGSATAPANSAAPVNIPVQGVGSGLATLSASASGYTGASLNVSVPPHLTALSPASGPSGTVVTVTGAGFAAPVTVQFGTTTPITVTPTSSTQLSVTVPQGLAAVTTPVIVTSNGQTSTPLNFTVTAPSISLTPSATSMTIQRGQSATYTVRVTWNNFSDPLDFVFDGASIPLGVSVTPSSGAGTLTTANPNINATISVQNNAISSASNIKLTVKKSGGSPSATSSLTLTVAPKAGNFVFRQAPGVPPPATPIFSPDGNFKAVITRQGTTRFYDAEFSTASGQVIATIPFEVQGGQLGGSGASNIAGIMFCHGSPTTTAAVISYDNLSSQLPMHKLTTLVLTDPGKNRQQLISGFSYRFAYIPQVGFSPDCSIIAAVGATPNSAITSISASGGVATFVDAQTNSWVAFSFSDPTTPVSASITAGRTITFSTPAGGSQPQTLP